LGQSPFGILLSMIPGRYVWGCLHPALNERFPLEFALFQILFKRSKWKLSTKTCANAQKVHNCLEGRQQR
jgi:hypothetical protein